MTNKLLTDKEEWELHYGGVRVSLEALLNKKKPNGPLKSVYSNASISKPGPYYDPNNAHLHIWKKGTKIKNFICEQNEKRPYIEYTESDVNQVYCSICHKKKNRDFVRKACKSTSDVPVEVQDEVPKNISTPLDIKVKRKGVPVSNWYKICYKLLYKPILYSVCPKMSILKYPWELTDYQKFRLNNPDYKNNCIFLKTYSKFYYDYLVIE